MWELGVSQQPVIKAPRSSGNERAWLTRWTPSGRCSVLHASGRRGYKCFKTQNVLLFTFAFTYDLSSKRNH